MLALFTGEKSRTTTHLINILGIYPFLRGRDRRDTVRFPRTGATDYYRKQLHASPSYGIGRATGDGHARKTRLYHKQPRTPCEYTDRQPGTRRRATNDRDKARSDDIVELKGCVVTRPVIGGYVIGRGFSY